MIAELFYPKELKEVIKDLREKDDLNEEALRNIHREAILKKIMQLLLGCIFLLIPLISEKHLVLIFSIFLASIPLICALSPISLLNRFIMPYACGNKTTCKVIGANYEFIPFHGYTGWSIRYEFKDQYLNRHEGVHIGIKRSVLEDKAVKIGDEMDIYYLPSTPSKNALLLPPMYRKYSIRINAGES